jgi:UDP:flavonoid glycosyltransferase YjiC (YdhE family)
MMRITILAIGSLGDVRPYVALGAGLRAAGYAVRIATHAQHASLAREHGLDFSALAGDSLAVLGSADGHRWQASGGNPLRFVAGLIQVAEPLLRRLVEQCHRACLDADAIIASPLGFCAGYHVAEKLRAALVPAFYVPMSPTRAFPAVMWPTRSFGALNWWTHRLSAHALWEPLRPALNRVRRDVLDLPPLSPGRVVREFFAERWEVLYGYSPTLVPTPRDWGDRHHVTGYWFLNGAGDSQPSPALLDFLGAGPAPVYVGFGSMQLADAGATTALVVDALAACGQRGVLSCPPGGLLGVDLPRHVMSIESAPHDWLFPQMAAVVHHGGAGTTATAVRAGVPSVVVPFFADQPFWGWRLAGLQIAPPPIARKSLTVARLASAIRLAVSDVHLRERTCEVAARIRREEGVTRAVEVFDRQIRCA